MPRQIHWAATERATGSVLRVLPVLQALPVLRTALLAGPGRTGRWTRGWLRRWASWGRTSGRAGPVNGALPGRFGQRELLNNLILLLLQRTTLGNRRRRPHQAGRSQSETDD